MPNLIVLQLHPVEPMTADNFEKSLQGLTIAAYDLSYAHPTVAESDLKADNLIGQVQYLPNALLKTRVVQHVKLGGDKSGLQMVATAVIEVTPTAVHVEYMTMGRFRQAFVAHQMDMVDIAANKDVSV